MRAFTDEHRHKLSLSHKGQVSWRKGKKFVDETAAKEKRKAYIKMWRSENKDKVTEYNRNWASEHRHHLAELARERYRGNKEKELDRIRLKKYGITGDEFRHIFELQGSRCPICNRDISKNPSVDHDHVTGRIRGLICNSCNLAIGNADDSADRLRAMANYLENSL